MPKDTSTERRKRFADYIESEGTIMVKPCATCSKHGRVCRVHVRSGKCSECLRRNQRCDIRVSQSEWDRLKQERKRLRDAIKDAYHAQEQARKEADLARERQQTAFAREMRLRQQLDLLDKKEEEAVAAEYAGIEQEEVDAALLEFSANTPGLTLGPETWNAIDSGFELSSEFWNVDSAGTAAEASASS
ncbi:hypothetical protein KCU64_g10001, partial [Aureobasidium melanogenum]